MAPPGLVLEGEIERSWKYAASDTRERSGERFNAAIF